ncbi:MAG: hypothetical protein KU37_11295 [Sulfuricurvum sp. PC08-66]|nr:MAG: hypothetical protein KU37_11295 [Sulfuricurvum sp. PC08-66]
MLEINPNLLGLTIVLFLVMIVLLNSWLYRPMLSFMQTRDENLKKDLARAGSNDSEIMALHKKAEEVVHEAKAEAAALRKKVIEDAKMLAQSKIDAKRVELDAAYKVFTTQLASEKESLKNNLLSQMPLYREALKAKFSKL